MRDHPNKAWTESIGGHKGRGSNWFNSNVSCGSAKANMQLAIAHPDIVEQYLLDEIASDNVAGSFTLTLGGLSHSESIDNLSVVFVGSAQRGIKRALGVNHVPLVCHFSITSSH